MHRRIFPAILIFMISYLAISAFQSIETASEFSSHAKDRTKFKDGDIIGCGPNSLPPDPLDKTGRMMLPLPGWGTHTWKVNTLDDSARFYFNQGLNLFYSFHMAEAKLSFLEAQRHDSTFAMACWGQAMSSGPYINNPNFQFNDSSIIASLNNAVTWANDPLEKALIKAQQKRFVNEKDVSNQQLAIAYRDEMKLIYDMYPSNVEVGVLYADAAMIVNARNWYTQQGQPNPDTDEIIRLLELIIKKAPDHPAALHYYIHMVEPSLTPGRGTEASDKLLYLLPSVTHIVHMPSHIYIRTGNYSKAILANRLAIEGYDRYKMIIGNGWEGSRGLYLYHNADMQGANASLMGNYAKAKKSYQQNIDRFNKKDTVLFSRGYYSQLFTSQPYLLNIRFGKWKNILAVNQPLSNYTVHKILWQFGQGMALAKTNNIKLAHDALSAIKEMLVDTILYTPSTIISRAIDVLAVPVNILAGTIALAEKKETDAIRLFKDAVMAEDTLRYAEPEAWRLSARHFLGQAYLENRDYKNARKIFEEDLIDHPNNFWAVSGLIQVLQKQNNKFELSEFRKKYKEVFRLADIKANGSVY